MKKLDGFRVVQLAGLLTFAAVLGGSDSASASMHLSGAVCRPTGSWAEGDFSYQDGKATNTGQYGNNVMCAMPGDHDIGNWLDFEIIVNDQATNDWVACQWVTMTGYDNMVYFSDWMSTDTGGTGIATLGVTHATSAAQNQRHFINCYLPAASGSQRSAVLGLRTF